LHKTKHEAIKARELKVPDEIDGDKVLWQVFYTMLECRGCGSVTLRRCVFCEDISYDKTDYYPPPISREIPRWSYDLPFVFQSLIKEIYTALHANSKQLALMGTRMLIDLFIKETIGDIGNFQEKLEKLVEDGYLSKKNKRILEVALNAGNAAAHRAHNPTSEDLNLVFDIVENLIQQLTFSKEKIDELKKRTPERPRF
jgi:hypothetical protein